MLYPRFDCRISKMFFAQNFELLPVDICAYFKYLTSASFGICGACKNAHFIANFDVSGALEWSINQAKINSAIAVNIFQLFPFFFWVSELISDNLSIINPTQMASQVTRMMVNNAKRTKNNQ